MLQVEEHDLEVDVFLINDLGDFIRRADDADYMQGSVRLARQIIARVDKDEMLDKEHAKWLEEHIELRIKSWMHECLHADKVGRLYGLVSQLEDKAVLTAIWNKYCRPGTYNV